MTNYVFCGKRRGALKEIFGKRNDEEKRALLSSKIYVKPHTVERNSMRIVTESFKEYIF